jgi:predicted ATP-grasp superfamily ATP-dependent carboligase
VTDGQARAAVAVCRGLHDAGHVATPLASTRLAPARWSRSAAGGPLTPDPRTDAPAFVDAVEEIVRRDDYDLLMPTTDVALLVLSEQRARLEPFVRLGLPPPDVVRATLDKQRLIEAAAEVGAPAPASVLCDDPATATAAARELGLPVVLKPRSSVLPAGSGFRRRAALIVDDERTLEQALPTFGAPMIVQRVQPGVPVVACGGVILSGEVVGTAVTRWHRRWPPRDGATSFCETVEQPSSLLPAVEALLQALAHEGIFELEFLDLGRGKFSAIDLNPRPFGWLALAVRAGANLPAIWCGWVCQGERASAAARPGTFYRREDADARHLVWQLRRGHVRAATRVLVPKRRVAHAHLELRDPLPFVALCASLATAGVRRARDRIRATRRS